MKKITIILTITILSFFELNAQIIDTVHISTVDGIQIDYIDGDESELNEPYFYKSSASIEINNVYSKDVVLLLHDWVSLEPTLGSFPYKIVKSNDLTVEYYIYNGLSLQNFKYFKASNTQHLPEELFVSRVREIILSHYNMAEKTIVGSCYLLTIDNDEQFYPIWKAARNNNVSTFMSGPTFSNDSITLKNYNLKTLSVFLSQKYGISVDYRGVDWQIGTDNRVFVDSPIDINKNWSLNQFLNYFNNERYLNLEIIPNKNREITYFYFITE